MSESTQHKLDRVRPPRVQITYDVEIGGAIEMKELPFVGGIMADLSGKRDPEAPLPLLKERKFVEIDRDNYGEVMESINPRVAFGVDNKLEPNGKLNVALEFKTFAEVFRKEGREFQSIDFFSPLAVVKQVPGLLDLFEKRQRLSDLIAKLDGNDKLNDLLRDIVEDTAKLEEVKKASAETAPEEGSGEAAPAEPAE